MTMTMTSNLLSHLHPAKKKTYILQNKVILRHNSLNITESDIYANFI